MEYLLFYLVGIVVGAITMKLISRKAYRKSKGAIMVDFSDPEGPYFFLQLDGDPYSICEDRYATFEVVIRKSQK